MNQDSSKRCSILVVDDDPDVQKLIRVALAGDATRSRARRAPAMRSITFDRHVDVNALVLDLMRPDLDGTEFRRIQHRDRSLAWIVMSAAIEADPMARHAHTDAFVGKPLDLDDLRRAVVRAVVLVAGTHRVRSAVAVELATRERRLYHPRDAG